MDGVVLQSVTKIFRHRAALPSFFAKERSGETRALNQVSLTAAPGEVLVLLGPNGAGKTTLLKLISTMLLPDSGRVLVGGIDTAGDPGSVRRRVGYAVASERSFFPRLTAWENLDFFAALDEVPRAERGQRLGWALETAGLTEAASTLAMKFSTGMYQRLAIARALLKKPTVLLLDEPTRSLDPEAAGRLWQLIKTTAGQGSTVVMSTHNFEEVVAVGTLVAILRRGRLATCRRMTSVDTTEELRLFYRRELGANDATAETPARSTR